MLSTMNEENHTRVIKNKGADSCQTSQVNGRRIVSWEGVQAIGVSTLQSYSCQTPSMFRFCADITNRPKEGSRILLTDYLSKHLNFSSIDQRKC